MSDSSSRFPSGYLARFLDSRAAITLALLITLIWGSGSMPLYDLDEGAFTEATREMVASGNYTSIYLNGEPRHDKPVLIYWLQAASVHAFGLNEFALRLPSLLAGIGWVLALFYFARRVTDTATANVAALLLSLSLYVGIIAKAAIADALLNLFLVLAIFDIYRHFLEPSRPLLLRIFLWMGLGFMTKGPVAAFFPFLISGLFFASYGRFTEWLKLAFHPLGLLVFLAVVIPWHVAVYLDTGWAFFEGFYLHHNVSRYSDPMEGHGGSVFYFALVAPLLVMPFGGWFLRQLGSLRTAWQSPLDRYLWLWFVCVLVVFSFSGTKLPHYLLYGISGVLLLMARDRAALTNRWLALLPALGFFALLAGLPWIFDELAATTTRVYEQSLFALASAKFDGLARGALLLGLAVAMSALFWRLLRWQSLLLLGFVQAGLIAVIVVPVVMGSLQDGPKAAGLFVKQHDKSLVHFRAFQPSVSVYAERVVPHANPQPGQWVYVRNDHVDDFMSQPSPYRKEIVFEQAPATLIAIHEN